MCMYLRPQSTWAECSSLFGQIEQFSTEFQGMAHMGCLESSWLLPTPAWEINPVGGAGL